ncbi:MAG TPA: CvpA family protein [Balneolales bacterium]|nr:CvpA family protein [Balneolales bacterium]
MILFDWIVVIPLFYFAFRGFKNGLVKEVLSIAGIVLAIFLSIHFMDPLASVLKPMFDKHPSFAPYVAAFIIFFSVLIIVHLLIYLLTKLLTIVALSLPNRILGLLFGVLKTGLIISTILILLAGFNIPGKNIRIQSKTYPYIITLAPATFNIIAYFYPGANNYTDTIKQTLKNYNPINNIPVINRK